GQNGRAPSGFGRNGHLVRRKPRRYRSIGIDFLLPAGHFVSNPGSRDICQHALEPAPPERTLTGLLNDPEDGLIAGLVECDFLRGRREEIADRMVARSFGRACRVFVIGTSIVIWMHAPVVRPQMGNDQAPIAFE
ncbi:MAG: hypothetical protein ACHQAY_28110, partial [Hyphomicrobiales bacterium]